MFGADKGKLESSDKRLNGKKLRIGMVQARFNEAITDALAQACEAELLALGVRGRATWCGSRCPARSRCRWPCRPWPRARSTMP